MTPLDFNPPHDWLWNLLGSAGFFSLILGLGKLVQNRWNNRAVHRVEIAGNDAAWNATYRSRAEAHLSWDQDRRSDIQTLQGIVNSLLEHAGMPTRTFEPIPPAPSLFPDQPPAPPSTRNAPAKTAEETT